MRQVCRQREFRFTDGIHGEDSGEGFLNELDLRHPMAMLMMEVICHAASSRDWADSHSLPDPVLARTLQVLGELYDDVSEFLAGVLCNIRYSGSILRTAALHSVWLVGIIEAELVCMARG